MHLVSIVSFLICAFVCTCCVLYMNMDHTSSEYLDSLSIVLHNKQESSKILDKSTDIYATSEKSANVKNSKNDIMGFMNITDNMKGIENVAGNLREKSKVDQKEPHIKGCTYGIPMNSNTSNSPRYYIQDHSVHLVKPPVGNIDLVCCDTTKGRITIAVHPTWAPKGAERFLDMVTSGFFDTKVGLFRSLKGFLVQFGLHGIPSVQKAWHKKGSIADDPSWLPFGPSWRVHPNNTDLYRYQKGYVAYAGGGKNSRGTQLILAYDRNKMLGGGSPWEVPFGQLVGEESYEHIKQFSTKYGEKISQGKIQNQGNKYLEEFPDLDYIFDCNVIQEDVEWRPLR